MSTQESGQPNNVITNLPTAVAIASSAVSGSNALIGTSTPHGLRQGGYVDIFGHLTNVAINGRNRVFAVVDATHFVIAITVGGTAGASGTVQDLSFSTSFAIPSDGVDNESASSVNVPFNALADMTSWLALVTGGLSIAGYGLSQLDRDIAGTTPWLTLPNALAAGTWARNDNPCGLSCGVLPGDLVLVYATTTLGSLTTSGGTTKMAFGITIQNFAPFVTFGKVTASAQYVYYTATMPVPLNLFALYSVTTPIPAGLQFGIGVMPIDGANAGLTMIGDVQTAALVLRPTGKGQ